MVTATGQWILFLYLRKHLNTISRALEFAIHYNKPINVQRLSLNLHHKQRSMPGTLQVELRGLDTGLVLPSLLALMLIHISFNGILSVVWYLSSSGNLTPTNGSSCPAYTSTERQLLHVTRDPIVRCGPSFIAPQYPWHSFDYASWGLHHLNMHVLSSCRSGRKCKKYWWFTWLT